MPGIFAIGAPPARRVRVRPRCNSPFCERRVSGASDTPPHPRPDSRRVPMREPRSACAAAYFALRFGTTLCCLYTTVYRAILVEGEPPGERAGEPESP